MKKLQIQITIERNKNIVGMTADCTDKIAADKMEKLFNGILNQLKENSQQAS
jgi:hypothetical protein